MNKMWEIRENYSEPRYGYRINRRSSEVEDAYECGYEDGYRKAMKEAHSFYEDKEQYGEKRMK